MSYILLAINHKEQIVNVVGQYCSCINAMERAQIMEHNDAQEQDMHIKEYSVLFWYINSDSEAGLFASSEVSNSEIKYYVQEVDL